MVARFEEASVLVDDRAEHSDVLELVADVEEMDPEETKLARDVWRKYGDDFAARLADLEVGKHPYQTSR